MKTHTTGFKNAEKELGRQLRAVITYGNVTLEEEIYSITPHYNADLLKSVMKQLDLELSVDIPLETVLNCRIGILVNGSYEMLNYGNYVVYKSEKQEDTNTYKLTCYDKILYSMKQNEQLNITYPISIKDYLNAIANKLGLTVSTTTFYNESMMIQDELYLGLDYTYRDILDEIAQVTGSIICLNENDEILVKYPTQTNDIIDEEFLKDVNVEFGRKYGEINSIVLSRSGESDNVYLRDEESVAQNGLTEVKIVDNQIMNFNDRSDYLPGILNALNGLYYYINDFSSTGILYYDVGDLYNIQIGQNTYQCLMLNDEIDITTGIEEIIHTDLPEQSETDYTKADKTDRRINQTYLIVDKQNQQIESLITTQTDQNQKIARVTQTVDELNSKISDIVDVTTSLETNSARLEFEGINHSEPIRVVIHPVGVNISKLYPSISLKPSSNLTIKTRILRFFNTTTNETFDYELPDDLLYYDSENYDEFILDYDSLTCIVNKKCKWNNDGTVGLLTNQRTDEYIFPHIELTDGDYTVQLIQYNNGYLFVRLMVQNIYTTQFATKSELNSEISQTVDNINLSINNKLSGYSTTTEMNSAINLKANQITSSVSENYATKSELNSSTSSLNSKIDQTVTNISLTVDDIQEQVETAQSTADTATTKADNAQSSANTAQSTANSINTNLTTNYYTKTQTNSAINQKADSITSTVSQTYSTKTETATAKNEAINSANSSTDNKLKDYTETSKLGTAIEQNYEHVKVAWNQISEFIQMEILNNNSSLAFRQSTNNLLMALDKFGQHFYKNGNTIFGEMGVKTITEDNVSKNYIAFSVPSDYNNQIQDGMAWGITTTTDNVFHPILYIKNFEMPPEDSDSAQGELVLDGCDLVLGAIGSGIISGSIKIMDDGLGNVSFIDTDSNTVLMSIYPANQYMPGHQNGYIQILDKISFFSNQAGSNTLEIGDSNNSCVLTDDGHIVADDIYSRGYVGGIAFIDHSSEEIKKNFEKLKSGLDIIKNIDIYKYNYKIEDDKTKKHIGLVIGNDYKYSEEITNKNNTGVDIYSFTATCCKAIQEQQEQIEELQKEIKELKGGKE